MHLNPHLRSGYRILRFQIESRLRGFSVPSTPHLDRESAIAFRERITRANHYLEYGSGGSTVVARCTAHSIISVDSDRRFLHAVEQKIAGDGSNAETELIYANIGITKEWGKPVFTRPTQERLRKWRAYVERPWALIVARGQYPDLVFVDGRFRAACVMATLLRQPHHFDFCIMIDDYFDRPRYKIIETFAEVQPTGGRMAILKRRGDFDAAACQHTLENYYRDYH